MSASSNETSSAAESTNQPAAQQPSTHLSSAGHGGLIRRLAEQDKTPVLVLILCALVGLLAGGVGVAFDRMVSRVKFERVDALTFMADYQVLVWIGVFLLSALLAAFGYFLVHRFAPEAAGSGIQEIEGAMDGLRPVRWWRVLPVKFFGGLGTLGSGMVLGREGPTVQMGGAVAQMIADLFRLGKNPEIRNTLLAAGAAGGLTAAFNAPLAGVLFVIEEMRPQFRYSLISIKGIFLSVIMACLMVRFFTGQVPELPVGSLGFAPLNSLWLYLVLGMLFGVFGVLFNRMVFWSQDRFAALHGGQRKKFVLIGAVIGGTCGLLALLVPEVSGDGMSLVLIAAKGNFTITALLLIFFARVITTLMCFCSGAPGGIFAPSLAIGTLFGTAFGTLATMLFPQYNLEIATFSIAGMGALFAATVRAPLTGLVLVLEMTENYQLILPMLITVLGATLLAQALGGRPLYTVLLERTLQKQAQQQAAAAQAAASPSQSV
ncbi:MAG: H(+)/Cl(-) exchange transporter ClcA [Plesiomonas shigelloides]